MVLSDHGFELGALQDDPSKTRDMRRVSERFHRIEGAPGPLRFAAEWELGEWRASRDGMGNHVAREWDPEADGHAARVQRRGDAWQWEAWAPVVGGGYGHGTAETSDEARAAADAWLAARAKGGECPHSAEARARGVLCPGCERDDRAKGGG